MNNLSPAQVDARAKRIAEDALAERVATIQLGNSGRGPKVPGVRSAASARLDEIVESQFASIGRPMVTRAG